MADEKNTAIPADLAEIRERTGIMGNASDPSLDIEKEGDATVDDADPSAKAAIAEKLKPQADPKPKPQPKADEKPEGEEPEGGDDAEEVDEEEDGAEEKGGEKSTPAAPAKTKGKSPIKAAFQQIGELRNIVQELAVAIKESIPKKEAVSVEAVETSLQKLIKKAEDAGEDPEAIKLIVAAAQEEILKELKKEGVLSKDLSPELKEKLDVVEEIAEERADTRAVENFNTVEWPPFMTALKKEYPNASDSVLLQARDEMFRIATSEEGGLVIKKAKVNDKGQVVEQGKIKPYPLSYLLHENRSKFDAILKVAKGPKSSEGGSKNVRSDEADEAEGAKDTEMPLDEQSPATFLKMQKEKIDGNSREDIRITGSMS